MSQSPLRVEDVFEESPVSKEASPDAQGLHALLQAAFTSLEGEAASENTAPDTSAIDVTRNLAAATLRQGQVFDNLQQRIARLEQNSDQGAIRGDMRDLCDAMLQITGEKQKASAEAENKFQTLSGQLKQLQDEIAGQRAEAADFKSLILAMGESLRDEMGVLRTSLAQVTDEFDTAKGQITSLEETVSMLADGSIRSSEGLSVLNEALETAKTQIFSLSENSVYLAERLKIAEQVVEKFTRREKVLAGLHARAARTLQLG